MRPRLARFLVGYERALTPVLCLARSYPFLRYVRGGVPYYLSSIVVWIVLGYGPV